MALMAEPGPDGLIGLRAMQSAVSTADPAAVHNLVAAAEGPAEALGRRLRVLAGNAAVQSVHITFDRTEGELPEVAVTVLGAARASASRETLDQAVAAVAGDETATTCPGCKRPLMPAAYSRDCHACKRCERERVAAYSKMKRVEKQATRERIDGMS
jgi:hypothetical protein